MSALEVQIGGEHYKSSYQPIEFIVKHKLPKIEGDVVKYVTRHRKKNGVEDLKKALHYIELGEQLGHVWQSSEEESIVYEDAHRYAKENNLNNSELAIILACLAGDKFRAKERLSYLIRNYDTFY